MENMGIDKRRSKRAQAKSLVQFKGDNFVIFSNLTNLGEGGIFVNTCFMLDIGESIDLEFELPGVAKTIGARGTVVKRFEEETSSGEKGFGLGIKFSQIAEGDRTAIREYVQHLGFTR
jgi:Tfp pilus assembly protein PilZ